MRTKVMSFNKRYRDDTGYREAAGVGLDYSERVRRAAAPLSGPLHDHDGAVGAHDLVTTAKKAALGAALASSEASHRTKANEKLSVPSFPKSDEMTNWVCALGVATVVSGFIGDELEVKWLRVLEQSFRRVRVLRYEWYP